MQSLLPALLGSHVLRAVFLQLHERISDCKYPPFILCEGLQVLSWIILSLLVFSFQKTKSAKLPMVIRSWWIFSFLQSATTVVIDLRSILATHDDIGFEEWIDLFMLVCSFSQRENRNHIHRQQRNRATIESICGTAGRSQTAMSIWKSKYS